MNDEATYAADITVGQYAADISFPNVRWVMLFEDGDTMILESEEEIIFEGG